MSSSSGDKADDAEAACSASAETELGLLRALGHTGVSALYQDRQLRLVWSRNIPQTWKSRALIGSTDADFLPSGVARNVMSSKQAVLYSAQPQHVEINVPDKEGVRWFSLWIDPDAGTDGRVRGIVTTMVETTDQRRREQTLRALLREVSHRSKNLLAIIQSIATQTGRYSTTIEGFLSRFRGRIQSLASSQDLVTSSNWRGADLAELIAGQVSRYTAAPARAIRIEGEKPWLNPNAALHVGLALHELAVNSVSFGALSRPDGFVTVSARLVDGANGDPALSLVWSERIGAPQDGVPDQATREKRFGSVALERVVPASLNGEASLEISAGKLEYRLLIPPGNFEIDQDQPTPR